MSLIARFQIFFCAASAPSSSQGSKVCVLVAFLPVVYVSPKMSTLVSVCQSNSIELSSTRFPMGDQVGVPLSPVFR